LSSLRNKSQSTTFSEQAKPVCFLVCSSCPAAAIGCPAGHLLDPLAAYPNLPARVDSAHCLENFRYQTPLFPVPEQARDSSCEAFGVRVSIAYHELQSSSSFLSLLEISTAGTDALTFERSSPQSTFQRQNKQINSQPCGLPHPTSTLPSRQGLHLRRKHPQQPQIQHILLARIAGMANILFSRYPQRTGMELFPMAQVRPFAISLHPALPISHHGPPLPTPRFNRLRPAVLHVL
jgi:hypothetical protein